MIAKKKLNMNVVEAAKIRIKNIFSNNCKVYLDVSGGKDSIVMMSLVYDLIKSGEIDKNLLEVQFIDEEVIYDSVVKICEDWRKKFMMEGVKYTWYCIEHRNNNCFNALENNENFIPWDRYEKENWSRPIPKFAVTDTPFLMARVESYQQFLERQNKDGITIIGVRMSESINRQKYISIINSKGGITGTNKMYPIYDWTDSDVWKYIKDNNLDFPDVYLRMYEAGTPKKNLRVCNLFAIDTCQSLNVMFETYPDLWEKILKREPNAYLVRLYWDSEMFHRETKTKRKLEENVDKNEEDYRKKIFEVVNNPEKYFNNPHSISVCKQYRAMAIKMNNMIDNNHYKKLLNALMAGDTKTRTLRAIQTSITADYAKRNNLDKIKYIER